MDQSTSTTRNYKHLSAEDREDISNGLAAGKSMTDIAKSMDRNPTTISREIGINGSPVRNCRYRCHRAQLRSDIRSEQAHHRDRLAEPRVRKYVEDNLSIGVTPELIAGRIRIDRPGLITNHESIYQWIYEDRNDLIQFLPRSRRKRHKRACLMQNWVGKIPNRVAITERPVEAESQLIPGHWVN